MARLGHPRRRRELTVLMRSGRGKIRTAESSTFRKAVLIAVDVRRVVRGLRAGLLLPAWSEPASRAGLRPGYVGRPGPAPAFGASGEVPGRPQRAARKGDKVTGSTSGRQHPVDRSHDRAWPARHCRPWLAPDAAARAAYGRKMRWSAGPWRGRCPRWRWHSGAGRLGPSSFCPSPGGTCGGIFARCCGRRRSCWRWRPLASLPSTPALHRRPDDHRAQHRHAAIGDAGADRGRHLPVVP